ncbi:MAG: hypothetical protein KAS72_10090 [Phycisphaerales bacterium]|nr:hypothetical protein [Phycisphaerales bacterium]
MKRSQCLTSAMLTLAVGAIASAVIPTFQQLNWMDANGMDLIPFSRVCEMDLDPQSTDPFDQQFLEVNGGGWVNVVIQMPGDPDYHWVVQNLYICYPNEEYMDTSSPSVQFGLPIPNGVYVEGLFFDMRVTPEALEYFEPMPDMYIFLEHIDYHAGGFNGGGTGVSTIPWEIGGWIGPDPFCFWPVREAQILISVGQLHAVDEGPNGCAPASAARSIKYLGDTNGFTTDNVQDVYDDLHGTMETNPASGTSDDNMRDGKKQYTTANGLPITTTMGYGFAGMIDGIMDALDEGADVEILIAWNGNGGHAAMVTGVTAHADGSYTITYVDDPNQGDGQAENEEHTIHVNPDGSFAGGQVDGFMVERHGPPGDTNGDGTVDQQDLGTLLGSYGAGSGDPNYDPDADIDGDGTVSQSDLGIQLGNYGDEY